MVVTIFDFSKLTNFELWQMIFSGLTAFALVFGVIQIKINQKQLRLSVIDRCITEYRSLENLTKTTNDKKNLKNYIDLVNEELFYIQRGYLPTDIAKEWIDGTIDYIPITNKTGPRITLNENICIDLLKNGRLEFFAAFPRIRNAFSIIGNYNFELIYSMDENLLIQRTQERKKLIIEIIKNVKKFDHYD